MKVLATFEDCCFVDAGYDVFENVGRAGVNLSRDDAGFRSSYSDWDENAAGWSSSQFVWWVELTEEEKREALDLREKHWQALIERADDASLSKRNREEAIAELAAFRAEYLDDEGSLKPVLYRPLSGFTRYHAARWSLVHEQIKRDDFNGTHQPLWYRWNGSVKVHVTEDVDGSADRFALMDNLQHFHARNRLSKLQCLAYIRDAETINKVYEEESGKPASKATPNMKYRALFGASHGQWLASIEKLEKARRIDLLVLSGVKPMKDGTIISATDSQYVDGEAIPYPALQKAVKHGLTTASRDKFIASNPAEAKNVPLLNTKSAAITFLRRLSGLDSDDKIETFTKAKALAASQNHGDLFHQYLSLMLAASYKEAEKLAECLVEVVGDEELATIITCWNEENPGDDADSDVADSDSIDA